MNEKCDRYLAFLVALMTGISVLTFAVVMVTPSHSYAGQQSSDGQFKNSERLAAPSGILSGRASSKDRNIFDASAFWVWLSDSNHWLLIGTLILAVTGIAQVEIARRTAKRQLRAYVQVSSCGVLDAATIEMGKGGHNPLLGGLLTGSMLIRNTGQTPAYRLVHWGLITVLPFDQQDTLIPPKVLPDLSASILGIGIENNKFLKMERQMTMDELHGILAATHAIFVYGCIQYRDIFRRKRVTEYRLSFTGSYPPAPGVSMAFCAHGNRAT